MASMGRRCLAVSLVVTAALAVGMPGNAAEPEALAKALWGWATVRQPGAASIPAAPDQGSMAGDQASVEFLPLHGRHRVRLGGVQNAPCSGQGCVGVWLVSPVATAPMVCEAGGALPDEPANVEVACWDVDQGATARPRFSVAFLARRAGFGDITYGRVISDAGSSTFYLDATQSFNAAGAPPEALRLGIGYYRLWLPEQPVASRGNLVVSPNTCRITDRQDLTGPDTGGYVLLRCYGYGGVPYDTNFTFLYTHGVGMQGVPGRTGAYLLADRPTVTSYRPTAAHRWSSSGRPITVQRLGKGRYRVKLPGMPLGGSAVVVGVGGGKARCQIGGIEKGSLPQRVAVRCFTPTGAPVDSPFSLSYVGG